MMMTELRMMMTITAQVGITRVMITGGGDGGTGLLLSISCEEEVKGIVMSVIRK